MSIVKFQVSGEEINKVIEERLDPALDGLPTGTCILSMLTLIIEILRPDLEGEELIKEVMEASKMLMLSVAQDGLETIH